MSCMNATVAREANRRQEVEAQLRTANRERDAALARQHEMFKAVASHKLNRDEDASHLDTALYETTAMLERETPASPQDDGGEGLERIAGALDQAADELEKIADGDDPNRVSFNQWERDRILEQRTSLRSLAEEARPPQPASPSPVEGLRKTLASEEMVHALYCYAPGLNTDDDAGPNEAEAMLLRSWLDAFWAALSDLAVPATSDQEAGEVEG